MESINARASTAIPPPALLDVPEQSFWRYARERKLASPSARTVFARLLTFGGALALTVYASREMIAVVSFGTGASFLQWVMVVLFTITFGWPSIWRARYFANSRPSRSVGPPAPEPTRSVRRFPL